MMIDMLNFISPINFLVTFIKPMLEFRLFFMLSQYAHASLKLLSALCVCVLLSHCAITPSTITKGSLTAKPSSANNAQRTEGSIYAASHFRPLFEDRRPRIVGDIITINILENTNASKDGSSAASKNGAVDTSIASFRGKAIPGASLSASSDISYSDDANSASSNRFNGFITTTVVEVLANGNLVVSGEKQVALDRGTEFVRFSGVVNPDQVALGNMIPSSRVADARIEYRSNSNLDAASVASILSRFFFSFIPL